MRLIINADDLGIDISRNRGIFQTVDAGAVKSVSVIVAQTGWKDCINGLIQRPQLGAGFHFNLTAGKPLVQGLKTLVNENGFFFNKSELFNRAMQRVINPQEVKDELQAQLALLKAQGIVPTHIDGHNHVHLFPGVRQAFVQVVAEGMWVRLPLQANAELHDPSILEPQEVFNNLAQLVKVLAYLAKMAQSEWWQRFRYVDDFGGTISTDQPSLESFEREIKSLNGEVCEFMCHPGDAPNEDSVRFSRLKARQVERDILVSNEFKLFLQEEHIKTISYHDLKIS